MRRRHTRLLIGNVIISITRHNGIRQHVTLSTRRQLRDGYEEYTLRRAGGNDVNARRMARRCASVWHDNGITQVVEYTVTPE